MFVSRRLSTGVTSSLNHSIRLLSNASANAAYVYIERFDNGVAHLALNRHDGKNSLSKKMLEEFNNSVKELSTDKKVSVLVVKSTVEKVFCAGADLKERATVPDDQVGALVEGLRNAFDGLAKLPMPTIAAVDGVALGGGLELALACDIRIAHETALLGLPETGLAIIPGAGGTQRLPRVVGLAKAKELIFTGRRMNGHEALQVGLVSECVVGKTAAERGHELASSIAEKGPIALRMAKQAMDRGMEVPLQAALKIEGECYGNVIFTHDRKEGLLAFKEKRKPAYRGE